MTDNENDQTNIDFRELVISLILETKVLKNA